MPPFHDTWRDLMKAIRSFASASTFAGPCASIYLLAAASCGLREQTHTHTRNQSSMRNKTNTQHTTPRTHLVTHLRLRALVVYVAGRRHGAHHRHQEEEGAARRHSPPAPGTSVVHAGVDQLRAGLSLAPANLCLAKHTTQNTPQHKTSEKRQNGCVSVEPLNTKASTRTGETPARN